jgi:pseudaminic acid biosynthesis-associated methylase
MTGLKRTTPKFDEDSMPATTLETQQASTWSGNFGREYTDRNAQTVQDMELLYSASFGVLRSAMNEEFLGSLDKSLKILEVGANVGVQLELLSQMGFQNLTGIELQDYAIDAAKQLRPQINIVQGNALELPFEDNHFDLVFTSGVLIHIAPENHDRVMSEMVRCSRRFIWGFEYYAPSLTDVNYRGHENLLWKADFASEFRNRFPSLALLKQQQYPYLSQPNLTDAMYLLEK